MIILAHLNTDKVSDNVVNSHGKESTRSDAVKMKMRLGYKYVVLLAI